MLDLADRLRGDGVDCKIDQHVFGSPTEGWPLWMERSIERAAYVVVVCTDVYLRRYDGKEEPPKGRGATWEAMLTRQDLYESGPNNAKYLPVLFEGSLSDIPKPLRSHTFYKCAFARFRAAPPRTPNGVPFFERFWTRRLTVGSV